MVVQLIANRVMKIAGRLVKAGETFEISDRYARTLLATKRAGKAPDKPKKAAKKEPAEEVSEPAEEKPKKTYKTRQLKAEDND